MAERDLHKRDPLNAVRVGVKTQPLSDLYFRVLAAPWWGLFAGVLAAYLLANLAFAGLYFSCDDCVEAVHPDSFADAFFFSVQTISTIGYGHVYPKSNLGQAIVTLESITGLLGFAVVTGLVFSKFSLPSARVLFSEPFLVTDYDGKRSVLFRLANGRGNEIVEANIRVAALLPVRTVEGHSLRRLYDLKLSRSRSPMFALSWLVIHEIDEDSPLFGFSETDYEDKEVVLAVSFTGLDATFHDTVHARHLYRPEHLRWDAHFVDMISDTEDGRLRIDLDRIDQIETRVAAAPVAPAAPAAR